MVESINLDNWFPDYQTMQAIDQYLVSEWGIQYLYSFDQVAELMHRIGRRRWSKFEELCKKQSEVLVTAAMADFDIHALHVTQHRRTYMLDQIALTLELLQRFQPTGPVIDVGCQNGVLLKFLAQKVPNQLVGIDRSKQAIDAARTQLSGFENVSLNVGLVPFKPDGKYAVTICHDVLHHIPADKQLSAMGSLFEPLNDGGIAIISSANMSNPEWWDAIYPAMQEHCVELLAAGRVGGAKSGGSIDIPDAYCSSATCIFRKTGRSPDLIDLQSMFDQYSNYYESFWYPYALSASIPWNEKTYGFEAATRRKASR